MIVKNEKLVKTMNKNSNDDICEKDADDLYMRQIAYTDTFLSTSNFLEKKGFYKRIAEFANSGNTVIDVGCGDCRLIRHVKDSNPKATIIGVDINAPSLIIGNDTLETFGYNTNFHYGIYISKRPDAEVPTLVSDIATGDIFYKFEKENINLLQEDIRFGDIIRGRLEKDVGLADTIMYTIPGGFSPHIILEEGEQNYNSVKSGIEMNQCVMSLGMELLKDNGRMIWALRAGSKDPETFKDVSLEDINLSLFEPFYYINKVEIVNIDEQEQNLELPAYAIEKGTVYSTEDIRTVKHGFKLVILLIEMVRKSEK